MPALTDAQCLGLNSDHLIAIGPHHAGHPDAANAFFGLQARLSQEGFNLQIASSHRSFERQATIWARKLSGELPLLDANSQPLDRAALSPLEQIHAVLRWSALPGGSRHHWGSDFDLYDPNLLPEGQTLRLEPWEYRSGGYFAELFEALTQWAPHYEFDWPYAEDHGGVSPEPWHLSYLPLARPALRQINPALLRHCYANHPIAQQALVLTELEPLCQRYLFNVADNCL